MRGGWLEVEGERWRVRGGGLEMEGEGGCLAILNTHTHTHVHTHTHNTHTHAHTHTYTDICADIVCHAVTVHSVGHIRRRRRLMQ